MSTQTANESSTSRQITSDVPKSPPKWPLRPGVLVHVKCDTKQNLCANRAQSPQNTSQNASSLNNVSYASPLLSSNSRNTSTTESTTKMAIVPDLPARNTNAPITNNLDTSTAPLSNKKSIKPVARALIVDENDTLKIESNENDKTNNNRNDAIMTAASETTTGLLQSTANNSNNNNTSDANDELLRFTTSNLIERILGRLRWRREQSNNNNNNNNNTNANANANNGNENSGGILSKSNRRAVSLLRATGWFGSGKSTTSTTGLMSDNKKPNVNGITCTDAGKYLSTTSSIYLFAPKLF